MSNDNILKPIIDGLHDGLATLFDMYGNLIYRLVEGKKYVDEDKIIEIEECPIIDSVVKYEFIPISEGEKDIVNVFKLGVKEVYRLVEGCKEGLRACIGIDTNGNEVWIDMLNSHLLIVGMARWGKSSLVSAIIVGLMLRYTEKEVRFLLCDFKRLDVKQFDRYKHSIGWCATNKEEFKKQIKWLYKEIEKRAEILASTNSLNAIKHNSKSDNKLTYIVFVIDELPQLTSDKDTQELLHLIMSQCPAYGIYFILASQDASKNVIGRCKMNCPQTIGLRTKDETDSNLLIPGAELNNIRIKGRCKLDDGDLTEFQSFFITEEEIEARLKHLEK